MRFSPLNYLLSVALFGALWVVTAILMGNWLGENASFNERTPEEFLGLYRILLSVAAGIGVVLTVVWLSHGAKPATAARLDDAKRTWDILLVLALAIGLGIVVVTIVLFRGEGLSVGQHVLLALALSLVTWVPYWVSTLLWSPRGVMNVPRGRR